MQITHTFMSPSCQTQTEPFSRLRSTTIYKSRWMKMDPEKGGMMFAVRGKGLEELATSVTLPSNECSTLDH